VHALGEMELNELNATEKAKIYLIQHYLQFRISDAWLTMAKELETESVLPIPKDRVRINEIIQKNIDLASAIQKKQLELKQEEEKVSFFFVLFC
jgi:hypothetical protein